MKVEIIIEQYDNGIGIKRKDAEGETDPQNVVALEREQARTIGEMVWDDVRRMMDAELANVVKLEIGLQAVKE